MSSRNDLKIKELNILTLVGPKKNAHYMNLCLNKEVKVTYLYTVQYSELLHCKSGTGTKSHLTHVV
jgi:hypothetical protein